MKRQFAPERLDVAAFADAAAALSACDPLSLYRRLAAEANVPGGDSAVRWQAAGQQRAIGGDTAVPWMHLQAEASVTLVCQRCLGPVEVALQVDRWFRFAADETTAAAEDGEAQEDVLVASRDFDLRTLIEDELLMEQPVAPRHKVCPEAVRLSAADKDFDEAEAARPSPFAVIGNLCMRQPR